ncbi:His/Gly/Thr/Pro-type tRNA ligase C-terminal domain-containing protein [Aerophototrophica crusticola]|uniref:His/Gly/Thr/Pro-type tRNA ligase C-terminal domain-containing protein n=1 Tax=Aerophototrophica crusticola TaxID=1709002 RepID=UPI00384FE08B
MNTEIQLEPAKPKKQFAYADKAGIRYAVIMGPDEKARGEVTVKDMVSGEQHAVARAALAGWFAGK